MEWSGMEDRRMEVRTVGPHQCLALRINANLLEQFQVAEGAVQFAGQNRSKVDRLFGAIVKADLESVCGNDLERANSINRGTHRTTYFNGSMGAGLRHSCSRCQSVANSA